MRSGIVSIIGRPNVGKSTLINNLINNKVAITSDKVGTTRNIIYGIYNEDDIQIVFVDTPGIGKEKTKLGTIMYNKAVSQIDNDLVLFVVDIASGFGVNDQKILDRLKNEEKDVILILNKVDLIKNKDKLLMEIDRLKDMYDFLEIVPISAQNIDNVANLRNIVIKYLKDDIKYFPDDALTNVSEKFMIAEIIREKILFLTKEEVPHAVTVVVESLEFKKNIVNINALIVVDRDNLKGIIIGKNGKLLKSIGSLAREELEVFLNKKVFLELYVKSMTNWKNSDMKLRELGISELDY